jgi:transglutaminase-like putative cysteine protease
MAPRRAHEFAALALAALSAAAALSLGRVFASASFVLPVVGAAVLPHALGLVARRRGWRTAVVLALSLLGAVLYAIWVVEPSTTRLGIPTPTSLDALGGLLQDGYDDLRTAVVPAPVTDGALLLAVLATWVMAQTADLLAFRRDATVAAVAPALALFLWASTLGSADLRLRTTIGFAAAAAVFLLLQHQALLERRRALFAGRRVGAGTGLVAAGALAGLVAVVGGAVVGPALPGADSGALIDVKGLGTGGRGGSGSYRTEPPLARIGENFIEPQEVALFDVRAPAADYWRIAALDRYSSEAGGQWTLAAAGSDEVASGLEDENSTGTLLQEFRIAALDGRWMPAAYRPVDVEGGDALVVKASTTLVTGRESVQGLRYSVRSRVPPPTDALAGATGGAGGRVPAELADYARLPADFPKEVRRLATDVGAGATTPYERALALEQFFLDPGSGFTYSVDANVELGPSAQSESAISEFVLGSRRGFCVQFAGSYAVMARSLGLPARVAVGYTPGELDSQAGVYHVTSYDAHAWPEVWLDGVGWTRFEPTPPSALPGGSELPGRAAVPDTAGATAPAAPASDATTPTPSAAPATATPVDARPTTDVNIDAPASADDGGDELVSFSWRLLVVVLTVLAILAVSTAIVIVVAKARRRRRRRDRDDPGAIVTGAWEEAIDRLGEAGIRARPELTPFELAETAPARRIPTVEERLHALATTYTAVRYGPTPAAAASATEAWGHVDEIDRALRGDASLRERWRRRLDPAPLRR